MTATDALLRPRSPHSQPAPWRWEHATIDSGARWEERTGNPREDWRLWYRHWDGPREPERRTPIVAIHGLGLASMMCTPLGKRLGQDGPVFAPDLPGMGRSDKPRPPLTVDELTDAIGQWCDRVVDEPPVLVGVSIGAMISVAAAKANPQAYAGVVAVNPTVDPQKRHLPLLARQWPRQVRRQRKILQFAAARDYMRSGLRTPYTMATTALEHDTEAHTRDAQFPLLLVAGDFDSILRIEWVRELAQEAKCEAAIVPGGVHSMPHENSVELSRLVNHFVDTLSTDHREHLRSTQ